MKRKKTVLAAIFSFLVIGIGATVYGTNNQITQTDIENINSPDTKLLVSKIFLKDMNKEDAILPNEIENFVVTPMPNSNQIILTGNYGPKLTLIGVYEENNGIYNFFAPVGTFYEVPSIETVNLKPLNKNLIFLKEYADQKIGSYERSEFSRGFLWDGEKFKLVFSTQNNIIADWNDLWNEPGFQTGIPSQSQWRKVTEDTKLYLDNADIPKIKAVRNQNYLLSSNTDAKNIPTDDTYTVANSRTIEDIYTWSDKWQQFILDEKILSTTGEEVAIIEDFGSLPYALLDAFEPYVDKLRVVTSEGTAMLVNREDLTDIPQ